MAVTFTDKGILTNIVRRDHDSKTAAVSQLMETMRSGVGIHSPVLSPSSASQCLPLSWQRQTCPAACRKLWQIIFSTSLGLISGNFQLLPPLSGSSPRTDKQQLASLSAGCSQRWRAALCGQALAFLSCLAVAFVSSDGCLQESCPFEFPWEVVPQQSIPDRDKFQDLRQRKSQVLTALQCNLAKSRQCPIHHLKAEQIHQSHRKCEWKWTILQHQKTETQKCARKTRKTEHLPRQSTNQKITISLKNERQRRSGKFALSTEVNCKLIS